MNLCCWPRKEEMHDFGFGYVCLFQARPAKKCHPQAEEGG